MRLCWCCGTRAWQEQTFECNKGPWAHSTSCHLSGVSRRKEINDLFLQIFFFHHQAWMAETNATNVSGISIFCPRLSLLARLMSELEGFGTSWRLWTGCFQARRCLWDLFIYPHCFALFALNNLTAAWINAPALLVSVEADAKLRIT